MFVEPQTALESSLTTFVETQRDLESFLTGFVEPQISLESSLGTFVEPQTAVSNRPVRLGELDFYGRQQANMIGGVESGVFVGGFVAEEGNGRYLHSRRHEDVIQTGRLGILLSVGGGERP